jgi:hypothetical protein
MLNPFCFLAQTAVTYTAAAALGFDSSRIGACKYIHTRTAEAHMQRNCCIGVSLHRTVVNKAAAFCALGREGWRRLFWIVAGGGGRVKAEMKGVTYIF